MSLHSFLLGNRSPHVWKWGSLEHLFTLFTSTGILPKPRGRAQRDVVVGERTMQYKEPLEGSKCPWRGKKRKKSVVDERWGRVSEGELGGNPAGF